MIGYKYVRIFFSEPLSSLDPSEIEIRAAKSKQLYSLESVKLSGTGLFADVILYGSYDADGTTFLMPNTPYVATITHDGLTDSLEFELPATVADEVVIAVDEDENMIYTQTSGRTQAIHYGAGVDEYYLGTSYEGNIGELLGRTVNFGFDGDGVITDLTVQDEVVAIDTMKFVNGDGKATISKKDYFKTNDGTKYYFEDTTTATKNATNVLAASDATNKSNGVNFVGFTPADGDVYDYVRLTLNPTGTIATAVLNANNTDFIKVASVDDNVVIADKNTSMNFSGYTMFNNEELISTDDLEEGDVVYYSIGDQFAYVYNETISGELDNVIHEKLDLDGTTYTWTNAKYFDNGDSKYKVLEADTDAHSVASQKYLNSLDPDDVELTLKMNGTIAYVDGEVVGESETNTTTYVLTKAPELKEVGFDNQFKLPVNDGTDSSTITFKPEDLKSLDGEGGKTTAVTPHSVSGGVTTTWAITFEPTDGAPATIAKAEGTNYKYTELVDVTTDAATGAVVGLNELDAAATAGTPVTGVSNADGGFSSATTTVTTGAATYAVTASTKVWVVKDKTGSTTESDSVKMFKFSDFTMATKTVTGATAFALTVYPDKANAKHIVIHQTGSDANTWTNGDTDFKLGMVRGETKIAKGDGTDALVVKTITIQDATGETITLDANGEVADTVANGQLVQVEYTKSGLKVVGIATTTPNAWTTTSGKQWKTTAYDSGVVKLDDATELRPYSDCLILKHYQVGLEDHWDDITIGEINSSKNGWNVSYHDVSNDGAKHTVDFIVVDEYPVPRTVVAANTALTANLGALTTACTNLAGSTKINHTTNKTAADDALTDANNAIAAWEAATGETFATSTYTTTEKSQYDRDVAKITAYENAAAETITLTYSPTTVVTTATPATITGWTMSNFATSDATATVNATNGTVTGVADGPATITCDASKAGYWKALTATLTIDVP